MQYSHETRRASWMRTSSVTWLLLIYTVPSEPSRLRATSGAS